MGKIKIDIKNISKRKKIIAAAVLITSAVITAIAVRENASKKTAASEGKVSTSIVEKRTITSQLSSSGTIAAKDTYSITSLVEGEVISADFEEGDQVEKGQVLYQIDVSSMETELKSANNTLARAESDYQTALEDYNEALSKYSGNTYKSVEEGYIKTLYIKEGDKISSGTKIADLYDDRIMELRLPFLSNEAVNIAAGSEAIITLSDSMEQLGGTVKTVSNLEEVLSGGRLVRYVTIRVENPGGLSPDLTATASVGEFTSSLEGSFTASVDTVLSADIDASADLETLLVNEGDYLSKGTPVFRIEEKSAEKLIRSFKDSLDKAEESVESAQSKLESTQDNYENYTVTAPIAGQIITKSVKAGDNISKSSSGSTTLAVIYDLSKYTFEMSVDELDVGKVKVGQSVKVTADAIEGVTFTGSVTNVSLESSNSNGVTNYPVTVTLDETGDLLPGMNVDGVIILEEAENVLTIPSDSLIRGNRVYVKDDSVTEANGPVPAGFKPVEVETGLISDEYVEIVNGLSEGDEVYVAASTVDSQNASMPGEMMVMPGGGPNGGGPNGSGGGNRGGGNRGGGPGM